MGATETQGEEHMTKDKALRIALEYMNGTLVTDHLTGYDRKRYVMEAIREALAEQPAQQQDIDWKDQYEKQKRRAEMWVAKYEADIKPLEKAGPVTAQQQEPTLWQILNGVCHAGVRSTENLAKEAAAGMQKTHDLGGSLAAFHVRPLYTSPPHRNPLTDEELSHIHEEYHDCYGQPINSAENGWAYERAIIRAANGTGEKA